MFNKCEILEVVIVLFSNSVNEFGSTCKSKDVEIRIYQKQLKIEQHITFEGSRSWQRNFQKQFSL